jgi:hypothetical protein
VYSAAPDNSFRWMDVMVMDTKDLDDTIRLFPQAAEIRMEYELAKLCYPNYSISYDENGHYWKMNDRRITTGGNFKGFVPKWLRDNDAAFALMVRMRKFPTQLSGGLTIMDRVGKDRIVTEMYLDYENEYDWESEVQMKERVARIVILKGALYFANTDTGIGTLF